ncbi:MULTISPECIES: ABC transporter ATP-binding protein [environmental samples]|jgi:ATP-binding cassette subfamily B multidrug efflux pump|uniref:ABC transporter ATP-binding protein n=1 Tax=environmental samples TaxID=876090 RepID=UPI000334C1DD|nr:MULTISPECIES: ABC transporter ATP-binding protein [environmental samples]CDC67989.1 putative ABC transporter permease/ATP-binding protein [Oscillibacter sp. CAG:155]
MLKTLWPHARPYSKWICLGVLCSAAEAVFELLIPLVMSDIVDIGIANGDQDFILRKGIQMVIMAMVSLCFGLGGATCSSIAGMGFGANLRAAEYDHIQDYAFSNIEKFSTASLVTRLTNDVNNLQMTLMFAMRLLVRAPVMLVAALFLSVRISYQLSNVFLVALPLLVVSVALILSKASPRFRAMQEKTDALNLVVQENLTGIRVVKSFVREDHEREKFAKRNLDLKSNAEKAFGMVVINMPIMMLIVYGTIIAVMWFGGQMVYAGSLEAGKLITFFTYITQIMMSLMMVSMIFMMMTRSIACARRIAEVLREKPAITNDEAKLDTGADGSKVPAEVKNGSIDFDHVSFKYDLTSPEWILRDIDLHIRSGQTVGILGGTGSAKTTLVSLIPRLYEATEGTVEVGGRPVADYTMEHLRDAVSVVLQKNTLFSGTIRENLLWGNPDATEEQLWAACRAACADEFLERMPDGLDTDLGQGGVNVSGGQKQRLCIARAILKQPKVLILDDSTSAVDTATDAKIRKAFANELKDTTKIIIAQRVTSICEADLILVMDGGRIVAQGTHDELMNNCDIYREVYQSQQEGVSIGG